MSNKTPVILFKNGSKEKTVSADSLHEYLEDMWHVAETIRGNTQLTNKERKHISEKILEVWHIACTLSRHIVDDKSDEEVIDLQAKLDSIQVSAREIMQHFE